MFLNNFVVSPFEESLMRSIIEEFELPRYAKYRMKEDEHKHTLEVELPGVKKSDVSISIDDDRITIEYKKDGKDGQLHFSNRGLSEEIEATLENGLLTVTFQKKKRKKVIVK